MILFNVQGRQAREVLFVNARAVQDYLGPLRTASDRRVIVQGMYTGLT